MKGNAPANKMKAVSKVTSLIDSIFSWSPEDILNEDLYRNQLGKIPESFQSVPHYFKSYRCLLLEETRAELSSRLEDTSRAPFAEVISAEESKPYGTLSYNVRIDSWRNRLFNRGKDPYRTLPGDIFVISDVKPDTVSDLRCSGRTWALIWVLNVTENENSPSANDGTLSCLNVKASGDIGVKDGLQKSLYVVFLMNITTNNRIWKSLHFFGNVNIIQEVLCTNSLAEEICDQCSLYNNALYAERLGLGLPSTLNESQRAAVLNSLCKMQCNHKSSVELIWGPPGTGKTKILSILLWTILRTNFKVLACAPTNVAVTEVASRVLNLVKESSVFIAGRRAFACSVGHLLLFGNTDRLKIGSNLEEIFLDYRVDKLVECFGPLTGWKHCLASMIDFFENCVSQYHIFLERESLSNKEGSRKKNESCEEQTSFLRFARKQFKSIVLPLRKTVEILCTHIPHSFLLENNVQNMVLLIELLDSFETLLFRDDAVSEEVIEIFLLPEVVQNSPISFVCTSTPLHVRSQCLSVLRIIQNSLDHVELPNARNRDSVTKFCFQRASLIFCTASTSFKLHSMMMEPLNLLIIDEAAQLKECESIIPLQLLGLRHAILIGDEYQLPATVNSKLSDEAGFGRSLFERLSVLGHSKHLLNIQYRMHPLISSFPNSKFYLNQILDAPNVSGTAYVKNYLPGPMFGPYSFISISGGREEVDNVGHSRKNMVEVAVVMKIVQNLYEAWNVSKKKVSVGVVSPYAAQVATIQEKFGSKYEKLSGFAVKVKSIDGFQGGEEDIIIISTVRSNGGRSIGFISNPRRINVALTRARHCLWIVGDGKTLASSDSVWDAVVHDAKDRQCFFDADEDKDLAKAILEVKEQLFQLDDLLNEDSILFKSARWKVIFSDNFRKSFGKIKSAQKKKSILVFLLKVSGGWRPKQRNEDSTSEVLLQILKQFKVEGLHVVCTIHIEKDLKYVQVLKVWDILPPADVPVLIKCLDSIYKMCTDDFLNHCKEKCIEGDLEMPMSWETFYRIVRYKNSGNFDSNSDSSAVTPAENHLENLNMKESLMLMKFYLLSYRAVSHLLTGCDNGELDLLHQVTDQELEMILCPRSTFVIGRPDSGKTSVLIMKLFQKEQQHHIASEGFSEAESSIVMNIGNKNEICGGIKKDEQTILHQIFVTVSPKLCAAVRKHIACLQSNTYYCERFSAESSLMEMHDIDGTQFMDIPDSFIDIPPKAFPLVTTFRKFLMMLDGTVANSFFERFYEVKELSHGRRSRSVALQTFIRTKEVDYDRFISSYWPHFHLTKKLDAFTVFTEITSHIKGGFQAGKIRDGELSRDEYILLSKGQASTLSRKRREIIYDIFLDYEKRKMENGEFDLADLVIDLHRRLRDEKYDGEKMDCVYIDEVQGLTMRQIALFKYICKNPIDGFNFSGDMAQTVVKGVDFRFQDIRYLFYKEFILKSEKDENDKRAEFGHISDIYHLNQNFHTHDGVLNLAQSVIDLLFHFFPLSIDILCPEKSDVSLINVESPVLLETGKAKNALITIFGSSGNLCNGANGFGAEQVILVRDDHAKKEIENHIRKQALVLTIMECQGLEFQDVLLYNFFGSSPLKNQWGVIYEYMKEQDMLDATLPMSFASFSQKYRNDLCWELKLLYVAITRSRERLWICENAEELSKPMFDYWKSLGLVQVCQLDDSLLHAMQVASSKEAWGTRGIKLYCEGKYEMAAMCFERAGDTYREQWANATSLQIAADHMRASNPKMARIILGKAAEIFDIIDRVESTARCYIELGDYEKAGTIYLRKFVDSRLEDAGDCFSLAGCYKLAAEVYARGNYFSKSLSACVSGKFFDMGLQFIRCWKEYATSDVGMAIRSQEIEELQHIFLETSLSWALRREP